ncbi:MAG: DUF4242 domain-containing protein [Rhodococcus sp. (in: high G+C Gram-positive bacteria)]|uniref:DUF4242 domain-containing protein n=1 Tax=Rhodococcus sp. TaxID=1831 RepID=UPI003BAF1F34
MDRYVIERTLPGAGQLSEQELHDISAKSNEVLSELGDNVCWVQSFVTDDKLYCIYDATDPALILQHAELGGFPCDSVKPVSVVISPQSGR